MAVILGLSGPRFSGKTVLADLVVSGAKEYGVEVKKLSFATPLKEEFCKEKGIGIETLLLPEVKEQYRAEMEAFSLRVKAENNNPNHFTDLLFAKILPLDNVVIDDVRLFTEEIMRIRQEQGYVWRVFTERQRRIDRGMLANPVTDISRFETESDLPADCYLSLFGTGWVFNNKSVLDLHLVADGLIKRHFLPKFQ